MKPLSGSVIGSLGTYKSYNLLYCSWLKSCTSFSIQLVGPVYPTIYHGFYVHSRCRTSAIRLPSYCFFKRQGECILNHLKWKIYLSLVLIVNFHGNLRGPPPQCHPPQQIRPYQGFFLARCCLGQVPGGAPFSQRSEQATACTNRMQIRN